MEILLISSPLLGGSNPETQQHFTETVINIITGLSIDRAIVLGSLFKSNTLTTAGYNVHDTMAVLRDFIMKIALSTSCESVMLVPGKNDRMESSFLPLVPSYITIVDGVHTYKLKDDTRLVIAASAASYRSDNFVESTIVDTLQQSVDNNTIFIGNIATDYTRYKNSLSQYVRQNVLRGVDDVIIGDSDNYCSFDNVRMLAPVWRHVSEEGLDISCNPAVYTYNTETGELSAIYTNLYGIVKHKPEPTHNEVRDIAREHTKVSDSLLSLLQEAGIKWKLPTSEKQLNKIHSIDYIEVENIGPHRGKISVNLNGNTQICGNTGAGKTFIIEGILFALYGYTTRGQAGHITSFGESGCGATVKLTSSIGKITVSRWCSSNNSSVVLEINDVKYEGTRQEVVNEINSIVGSYKIALATWFVSQNRQGSICWMTRSARSAIFDSLLGIDSIIQLQKQVASELEVRKNEARDITNRITNIEKLAALTHGMKDPATVLKDITVSTIDLEVLEKIKDDIEGCIGKLTDIHSYDLKISDLLHIPRYLEVKKEYNGIISGSAPDICKECPLLKLLGVEQRYYEIFNRMDPIELATLCVEIDPSLMAILKSFGLLDKTRDYAIKRLSYLLNDVENEIESRITVLDGSTAEIAEMQTKKLLEIQGELRVQGHDLSKDLCVCTDRISLLERILVLVKEKMAEEKASALLHELNASIADKISTFGMCATLDVVDSERYEVDLVIHENGVAYDPLLCSQGERTIIDYCVRIAFMRVLGLSDVIVVDELLDHLSNNHISNIGSVTDQLQLVFISHNTAVRSGIDTVTERLL